MFILTEDSTLFVELPAGRTQDQLVVLARNKIQDLIKNGKLFGLDLKINGRITTGMALMLGHELCHICKSISIFDPKENTYVTCIYH